LLIDVLIESHSMLLHSNNKKYFLFYCSLASRENDNIVSDTLFFLFPGQTIFFP
jgi:hypothetical protein